MQQKEKRTPLGTFSERFRTDKRLRYAAYAAIAAVALLLYAVGTERFSCAARAAPASMQSAVEQTASRDALEVRLIEVLSKIRGAGKVDVLVTYETTGEIVTAVSSRTDEEVRDAIAGQDSSSQRSVSTVTEPALVKNEAGQTPIVLSEKEPTVRGVIVVAEGAAQLSVRRDLQNAVRAVTGAAISKIEVFEMAAEPYNVSAE